MGVLTDLYIANVDEAEKLGLSEAAWEEFTGLDIKGLDYVPMSTLYGIIGETSFDEAMDNIESVYENGEEGPWVFKLSDNFVELLSALKGKNISTVVKAWSSTDELAGHETEMLVERLTEIIELAHNAKGQGKGLLMRMSL